MRGFKLSTAVPCTSQFSKGCVPPHSTVSNLANYSHYTEAMMILGGEVFAADTWQLYYQMILGPLRNVEIIKDTILNPQNSI